MSVTLNGTSGLVFSDGTIQGTAGGMAFRNRVINGDMRIDQRNAGASVNHPGSVLYTLDRWVLNCGSSSKISIQQNAGGVTPPAGFKNYLGITSLSSYAVTGNESYALEHITEGINIADFNWGTSNAAPAALSFWVRSSLTGTFGGSIATSNGTIWVMPFTYTISSANTWTYITVSVPAGTSAVPFTDSGAGIYVRFGLGSSGSNTGGTAGVWTSAGNFIQPATTVSVVGTNAATFYVTGVQFEKAAAPTLFEHRPIGTELALCQRYYERVTINGSMPVAITHVFGPATCYGVYPYKVEKRASPTGVSSGTFIALTASGAAAGGSLTFDTLTTSHARIGITGASGLTSGNASSVWGDSNPMMAFNAEL
jgi:hypothetical protein